MVGDETARMTAREALEKDENVLLAYVFGSTARGARQPISDIDIAVLLKNNSLEKQADVLCRIAKAFHVPEEKIDIVDLRRADTLLKYNILREGVKLVDRGFEGELVNDIVECYPEIGESLKIALREWLKGDPKIDQAIISRRLDEVLNNAAIIRERYAHKPVEWILADSERTLALERAMERIIESMVDVCRHIVSAKSLGLIETQAEYPLRLAQHQLMPESLAQKVAELSRIRNILAHRYLEIDYATLLAKAQETAEQIVPYFVDWTKKLLSSEE